MGGHDDQEGATAADAVRAELLVIECQVIGLGEFSMLLVSTSIIADWVTTHTPNNSAASLIGSLSVDQEKNRGRSYSVILRRRPTAVQCSGSDLKKQIEATRPAPYDLVFSILPPVLFDSIQSILIY